MSGSSSAPTLSVTPDDLDQLLRRDRQARRLYLLFSLCVALIGIAFVILGLRFPDPNALLKGLGGVVTCLTSLPMKEYLARKERLAILKSFKARLLDNPTTADISAIQTLIHDLYKNILLR